MLALHHEFLSDNGLLCFFLILQVLLIKIPILAIFAYTSPFVCLNVTPSFFEMGQTHLIIAKFAEYHQPYHTLDCSLTPDLHILQFSITDCKCSSISSLEESFLLGISTMIGASFLLSRKVLKATCCLLRCFPVWDKRYGLPHPRDWWWIGWLVRCCCFWRIDLAYPNSL